MINRGEYWQCGYVIAKGRFEQMRRHGFEIFREEIGGLALLPSERIGRLRDLGRCEVFDRQGRPIVRVVSAGTFVHRRCRSRDVSGWRGRHQSGDSRRGRCRQYSVQTAPAREVTVDPLRRIQKRRESPTRVTQGLQVMVQRRIIARVLSETKPLKPPVAARLLSRFPFLRRIPARVVGLGIRPEHVDPEIVHFGIKSNQQTTTA